MILLKLSTIFLEIRDSFSPFCLGTVRKVDKKLASASLFRPSAWASFALSSSSWVGYLVEEPACGCDTCNLSIYFL
jgi:hypothetical protein